MATFAKQGFNAAMYALARPTYPRALFESILSYHENTMRFPGAKARWNHALDLGSGTGQATSELLRPSTEEGLGFARVTGVEPSAKMIAEAKTFARTLGARGKGLSFVNSPAEKLDFLPDNSVDLVIAAQAAHWFDWERLWPELSRVMRHGGTVAFWVYSEMRFPQYPQLTPIITEYLQGTDPATSLGPHWEPGRRILNNHLLDISAPAQGWEDFSRVFFTGTHHPDLPEPHIDPILSKTTTWGGGLHSYLRTFSSLHRFQEMFPEDKNHPEGDIATRFLRSLMDVAEVPLTDEGLAQEVVIEWPMALVLARKELDGTDQWYLREQALEKRISLLTDPYNEAMRNKPATESVEEMTARFEDWSAVQREILGSVETEIEGLPEPLDVEDDAPGPHGELSAAAQYEEERFRYFELLQTKVTSLEWPLKFKESFAYALEQAIAIEAELGTEDIAAGVQAWLDRVNAEIEQARAGLPDLDDETELAFEQMENVSEEQVAAYERAQALEGIVQIVDELAKTVVNESIGEILKGLYISAGTEVTQEFTSKEPYEIFEEAEEEVEGEGEKAQQK